MGNGVGGGCRHVHGPQAILLFLSSSKIYAFHSYVVFKKIMRYGLVWFPLAKI
jgi:hypothetical protein